MYIAKQMLKGMIKTGDNFRGNCVSIYAGKFLAVGMADHPRYPLMGTKKKTAIQGTA